MVHSQRICNFAASIAIVAALLLFASCKGRTAENMVPDGDTIEVVINHNTDAADNVQPDTITENSNQ